MKKSILIAAVALLSTGALAVETNLSPGQVEANYTEAIEGRATDILKVLALTDTPKSAKVHDAIIAQYRALRTWHDENDARLKAAVGDTNAVADICASLKTIHDAFIARLSETLSPEQVERVKDKMTYNKVQVTYDAYCEIIPTLTTAQKARILELLKAAREEAMDGGSANEKSAIFKKYKGRIANYLSKEGVDESKARKEWAARQKEKAAAGTGSKTDITH
ncbi:MAG TPA: DUF3826 domain-containing protein [Candidatus Paceibacterota bacterium]|nr:DUF3826 domain-containing protein [Candidatus Paceibacterota bacterium]